MNRRRAVLVAGLVIVAFFIALASGMVNHDNGISTSADVKAVAPHGKKVKGTEDRKFRWDDLKEASEEQKLIERVSVWRNWRMPRKGEDAKEVPPAVEKGIAEAIKRLGEMKSTKAIPVLVDKIMFSYMPSQMLEEGASGHHTPLTQHAHALVALRKIGPSCAREVIGRIGELDKDKDFQELYRFWQVLLGIMDRKDAVALLKQRAKEAKDKTVKKRLMLSASKVASLPIDK